MLYLSLSITGENFSLIGALEGTFAAKGGGAIFAAERGQFLSLLRKTFIIFSFQNNNPIRAEQYFMEAQRGQH